jgi:hypothetical protein
MLMGCVLLGACAGAPVRREPEGLRFDTVTNACRQNPANCVALTGREAARASGTTIGMATAAGSAVARLLEKSAENLIDKALAECADLARSEVLLRHRQSFAGLSPTREECNERVKEATGRPVTRAMQLGTEMHQVALKCAKEKLGTLRPGGFSLEPRYRYDRKSGKTKQVSDEEAQALRESGNAGELRGTLVPDVVIHPGNPLHAQAIYDFKFQCVHTDDSPQWDRYPAGHPHQGLNQRQLYQEALGVTAKRVAPRTGVSP